MTAPASYAGERDGRTREFLRWIMVFMVAGLGLSIILQRINSGEDCWQTSLSAYWYTPVRSMFVGSLVSIGVCLLCMKGKTAAEDAALNFAGVLAPIVAIVPTPPPLHGSCDIPAGQGLDRTLLVENNLPPLYLIGGLALVFVFFLVARSSVRFTGLEKAGYIAAALVWAASFVYFLVDREGYLRKAHNTAAIVMFVAIALVVLINALLARRAGGSWLNRYSVIFSLMVGSAVLSGILAAVHWSHVVIAIEAAMIFLFAVFWFRQTSESHRQMQALVSPH